MVIKYATKIPDDTVSPVSQNHLTQNNFQKKQIVAS